MPPDGSPALSRATGSTKPGAPLAAAVHPAQSWSPLDMLPWLLLVACLGASVWYSRLGWNEPLLDSWSFRQTQTAISTEYLLRDGFRLDYETPVLGAPWSLPYEFPTYQFCVAAVAKLTGAPLDQTGRLVSLLFAYAAFALLGLWVSARTGSRTAGIYSAALALVSPVYLFGSRAFLIESTALCFTVGMLLATHRTLGRPSWANLAVLAVAASLAALTKATTYAIGLVGVAGMIALDWRDVWPKWRLLGLPARRLAGFALALGLPFVLALAWTHHTDVVKLRNELAQFTTSAALHSWNYGTWAQRLDFATWEKFLHWVNHFVFGMPLVWLVALVVTAVAAPLPRTAFVSLAMFLSGWLVFTNLYVVHEHYYYASGVYLLAFLGIAAGACWERGSLGARCAIGLVVMPGCVVLMLAGYVKHTLPDQVRPNRSLLQLAQTLEKLTPRDSVIITYGYDWESALPYYAHRRALMVRNMDAGDAPAIVRARHRLDHPIGAIVFRRPGPADYPTFVAEQLQKYDLGRLRVHSSPDADVFLAADPASVSAEVWQRAGFAGKPALFEAPLPFCELLVGGRSVMLAHAPGLIALTKEAGQDSVHCEFGLTPDAYTGNGATDGVTFVVEFENNVRQTTRLLERRLDPVHVPADRGLQSVTLPLPTEQIGLVRLRTLPGASNAFDWSVWRNVRLE